MDRRRGNLPTERGFRSAPVPQYLSQEIRVSTDSTASGDSIRTQIPLPYHIPQNQYNQDFNFVPQSGAGPFAPFAAPVLIQPSTNASGSKKSLNPTSSPYIPTGCLPEQNSRSFQLQPWQSNTNKVSHNESFVSNTSYQPQGSEMGSMAPQNCNQYNQERDMQLGGPVGGTNPQFQNPYSSAVGTHSYHGYAPSAQHNLYSAQIPYSASSVDSPVPSLANMMAPAQNLSLAYGLGNGNAANTPSSLMFNGSSNIMYDGQNQGSSNYHNDPSIRYTDQNHGSSTCSSVSSTTYNGLDRDGFSYNNASSMYSQNKPFSSFIGRQNISSTAQNQNSPSLATPPVLTYIGRNQQSNNSKLDGASLKVLGLASPEKSVRQSVTRGSSRGRQAYAIEDTNGIPTPGPKPHHLDLEFSSEPRHTETPQLRSRRGQSVSATATDPIRKKFISNWMESSSMDNSTINTADIKSRGSPIKILSLRAAGGADAGLLKAISESDPFNSRAAQKFNPFAAMSALPDPYNGSALVGQQGGMSRLLRGLTDSGKRKPSIQEALDPQNLPFAEFCRQAKPDTWGVIKIKNIPYSVNRPEVLAFLGRNARIVSEADNEPVHIIMERVTSKTLDCYVEFINMNEAVAAVNRFEVNRVGGRGGRLGQRHVEVELSTQEGLMKDLFPKAKNVAWEGSRPRIIPRDPNDQYNSGFQGFVSREEMVMLVKHVESPQRSPFSKDCPQRPFECLISTLLKYPWYMVDYITIEERNLLHKATKDLLHLLIDRVTNERENVNLTSMLLKRVWRAALKCQGFTPSMKDDIVYICGLDDQSAIDHGMAPYASHWKYLWTIGPKSNVPNDVVLWYIAVIRETCETKQQLSLAEQAEQGLAENELKLFGDLNKHTNYGKGLNQMTLAQVAKIEWAAIEKVLRQAFTLTLESAS